MRNIPNTITRKTALKLGLGASAGFMLGKAPIFAQNQIPITRTIPSTGEKIPAVGLGSSQTFNVGTLETERAPLRAVLRLFVEMGGTLFDTSPSYGRSEPVAGDLAAELGLQDKIFWATKISGATTVEQGIQQMATSMERFRQDHIELNQVHNLGNTATHLATLREWKQESRVRYLGITTSSDRQYEEMEQLMRTEDLDFIQVDYSIDNTSVVEDRLLPIARDRGQLALVNGPFGRARLFSRVAGVNIPEWAREELGINSWAQYFIKYILATPNTIPIPATSDPEHLVDNMGALFGPIPTQAQQTRLRTFFDSI
ncbi:aldo/keto reductase [Candidatus Neomarinimicrobiota bacterium]